MEDEGHSHCDAAAPLYLFAYCCSRVSLALEFFLQPPPRACLHLFNSSAPACPFQSNLPPFASISISLYYHHRRFDHLNSSCCLAPSICLAPRAHTSLLQTPTGTLCASIVPSRHRQDVEPAVAVEGVLRQRVADQRRADQRPGRQAAGAPTRGPPPEQRQGN